MSRRVRPQPTTTSGAAMASMATGILAFVVCWVPIIGLIAFPLGIAALATCVIGLRNARRASMAGRALAVTGGVTGGLALVVAFGVLFSFLAGFQGPAWNDDVDQVRDLFGTEFPRLPG